MIFGDVYGNWNGRGLVWIVIVGIRISGFYVNDIVLFLFLSGN